MSETKKNHRTRGKEAGERLRFDPTWKKGASLTPIVNFLSQKTFYVQRNSQVEKGIFWK